MADFVIGGVTYRHNRLDAMTQLGIACKLGGVLDHVQPVIQAVAQHSVAVRLAEQAGDDAPSLDFATFVPLGKALSALPDESRDFIVAAVLKATFRQNGPGFLPSWDSRSGKPIDEIDFMALVQILGHALKENLGNFTAAPV